MNKIFLVFLSAICFLGCKPESLDRQELESYILEEENALSKKVQVGKMVLELRYRPTELVWYRNLQQLTLQGRDSLMNEMKGRHYFVAIYSIAGEEGLDPLSRLVGNKKLHKEVLRNLSFRFGENVSLKQTDGDEILGVGGIFSKAYGMLPYNSVVFFFKDNEIDSMNQLKIKINDIGFGIGSQSFTFDKKDLEDLPHITL